MGICSSKSKIHCEGNIIENSAILSNYINPILIFKNHTICVSEFGNNLIIIILK